MTLYRYQPWAGFNIIDLHEVTILKETPCGYWVRDVQNFRRRWTSKTSFSRYAYPTKEEAMANLLHRSRVYRGILKQRLSRVEDTIRQAKVMSQAMLDEMRGEVAVEGVNKILEVWP